MKAITVNFTDSNNKVTKTYSTTSIKTGLVDKIFDLAEQAKQFEDVGADVEMVQVKAFFYDMKAVLVALFGNQFTYDELQDNVEQAELMRCFTSACMALTGAMGKNA